jgi:hypothetical protein
MRISIVLLLLCAGGEGKRKTPSETGGVLIFLERCGWLFRRGKSKGPRTGGFFGFQDAGASHGATIGPEHAEVNESSIAIHAAETSRH